MIDDHSRLCLAAKAFAQVRAPDVVSTFYEAASRHGLPESLLSDNGAVYTAAPRNGRCAIESELIALGILYKHSRPYHPQTCGKIERFHQTLKKHLAAQRPPRSLARLQAQIDRFIAYYNQSARTGRSSAGHPPRPTPRASRQSPRATLTHQPATTASATTGSTPAAPSRCATAAACATSPWEEQQGPPGGPARRRSRRSRAQHRGRDPAPARRSIPAASTSHSAKALSTMSRDICLRCLATPQIGDTGFEPATPGPQPDGRTRRPRQPSSYGHLLRPPRLRAQKPAGVRDLQAWRDPDSNWGHHDFQSCALPTELSRRDGRC